MLDVFIVAVLPLQFKEFWICKEEAFCGQTRKFASFFGRDESLHLGSFILSPSCGIGIVNGVGSHSNDHAPLQEITLKLVTHAKGG